jgi:hypothetical protein
MSVTAKIKRDKETGLEKEVQDFYITPIIGTCNLFKCRIQEIFGMHVGEKPTILENLLLNLEKLVTQYEEDKL